MGKLSGKGWEPEHGRAVGEGDGEGSGDLLVGHEEPRTILEGAMLLLSLGACREVGFRGMEWAP